VSESINPFAAADVLIWCARSHEIETAPNVAKLKTELECPIWRLVLE
jgi:hypothetical protein